MNKVYIGDGVYAEFDGWHIWLSTVREGCVEHRIALEPEVFNELLAYVEAISKSKPAAPAS